MDDTGRDDTLDVAADTIEEEQEDKATEFAEAAAAFETMELRGERLEQQGEVVNITIVPSRMEVDDEEREGPLIVIKAYCAASFPKKQVVKEKAPAAKLQVHTTLVTSKRSREQVLCACRTLPPAADVCGTMTTSKNNNNLSLDFINILKSEREMRKMAGVSLKLFYYILEQFSAVTPKDEYSADSVCNTAKVLATLIKLKTNTSFLLLGCLVGVTTTKCRIIFEESIAVIDAVLKGVVAWPSKDEIVRDLPDSFVSFKNVRVVLEYVEVKSGRKKGKSGMFECSSAECEKKSMKIKYMIGVSPAGLITHVSDVYSGCMSNKLVFIESKILDLCAADDALMVSPKFRDTSELCKRRGVKLIVCEPEGKKGGKGSSLQHYTKRKARDGIEEVIKRMKSFEILGKKFPRTLVPCASAVVNVVAALVNLYPHGGH